MRNNNINRKQGFTTILMVMASAIFVIGPIGIISFEFSRANLAREQLRAATDAAALAAAAALASANAESKSASLDARAINVGLEVFRQNSIAGHTLANARLSANADSDIPPADEVRVSFHLDDGATRASNGKSLKVQARAVVGYKPAFGAFLKLSEQAVRASSTAGLPKLDMIVLLDISASMLRSSKSILVQRKAVGRGNSVNDAGLSNEYVELTNGDKEDMEELAGLGIPHQPQRLKGNDVYRFSPDLRNRAGNAATPPGNLQRTTTGEFIATPVGANEFTDSIVDLRTSYSNVFPNLAVLVEASRGNLDNMDNFIRSNARNSSINPALVGVATKARYDALSKQGLEPFLSANNLVRNFIDDLHSTNDVHFSLIPFATLAAQPETDANAITKIKDYVVAKDYLPRDLGEPGTPGIGSYRLHQVPLERTKDNYTEVVDEIAKLGPQWGTNTADALTQAKRILDDGRQLRTDARPVVLLVTDGLPVSLRSKTGGGPLSDLITLNNIPEERVHPGMNMVTDSFNLATQFGGSGVPIYTVGFLHGSDPIREQLGRQVLSTISSNSNNASGFFLAKDVSQLSIALKNVQRHLITLQN